MRRAYADRAEYMGDADFVPVPTAGMIDKAYAERRRSTIKLDRASPSSEIGAGKPAGHDPPRPRISQLSTPAGNAVSNTYTLNGWFGLASWPKGPAYCSTTRWTTSRTNRARRICWRDPERRETRSRRGKRPLSSMTPTFVLRPNGTLYFAIGTPGGTTITNTVFK